MKNRKDILLGVLNNIMLITTGLIDSVLNHDTEVNDKHISDAEEAREWLRGLEILKELPF